MNLAKRSFYFFGGSIIGIIIVLFIAKQKNIQFPYGPDSRTLKSIRVKPHYYFSEQAQNAVDTYGLDSIRIAYLLSESDVDFSESDTDTSKPCQKYKINGELNDLEVSLLVKRCDSSATFEKITINKK
ncbi:DUF4258 domain-containing protein [Flavicella sediminum]|uniref:DUF4258 domain-containing protein n=1 Tax=Flavicella sediminum TaxID=2585141 RepID=UPI00111F0332|nr:DUF4258 domain-containing protein [Flavicella sediminum]